MKFVVAKVEDIEKHLSKERQHQLGDLLREVARGRIVEGKKAFNDYWVVNKDEPYSDEVRKLILNHTE